MALVPKLIAAMIERRKHPRLKLRIPLLLFLAESEDPIESETVNINSDGFYCTTREPLAPGDRLRGLLFFPASGDSMESGFCLDAEIKVMRVRMDNDTSGFGLGCRITDYHIVNQRTALK